MTSPAPSFWYLAQTKPRQEYIAAVNLERQGFLVNLPRISRIKPSARLSATEVLFPGYIFFAPSSQSQSIASVRSTLGVSRLVRFGQSVATLSSDLLACLFRSPRLPSAHHSSMTSRQSVLQEDTTFRVLRILEQEPSISQRELASRLGLSLGGLNYCLRALVDKGFVKLENFRNNPKKLGYLYVLTPAGVADKAALTGRFLQRKMAEIEALRVEIEEIKGSGGGPSVSLSGDAAMGTGPVKGPGPGSVIDIGIGIGK